MLAFLDTQPEINAFVNVMTFLAIIMLIIWLLRNFTGGGRPPSRDL